MRVGVVETAMTIERMRNGQDQVPGRILFWGAFVLGGVVLGLVATRFPDTLLRIALMTAGLTLYLSLIGISVRRLLFRRRTQRDLALIADFVMKDTVPAFVTGNLGEVIMANPAAARPVGRLDQRGPRRQIRAHADFGAQDRSRCHVVAG
jgi:hypothetical protein